MTPKMIERLTVLNTILLIVVSWKVFFGSNNEPVIQPSLESASVLAQKSTQPLDRPASTAPKEVPPSGGGADNYEELLLQTIEPLERAYAEHGESVDLPTDAQLQSAIATNSLKSTESQEVLRMLEAGYQRFNMPFPKLEIPVPRTSANKAPKRNDAPENTSPPPFGEWIRRSTETLLTELKTKKESSAGLVPTEQELQAAISSGDPLSEESRLVIDMLKNGYARLKLDFPEYGQSQSTDVASTTDESSKSLRQQVSQQRILRAYFEGQVQRLKLEAATQSKSVDEALPSSESIDAAVNSGSLKTKQAQDVIQQIKACYETLGLTFYSPPTGE